MKTCTKCNASVKTSKKQCPLCFNELEKAANSAVEHGIYPPAKPSLSTSSKNFFLSRLFLFITISVFSVCFFINFMVNFNVFWSLLVLVSMLYIWILVRHTIISKRSVFEKILFQFVGILSVIMATNYVAGGEDWFWNFVVPSASLATTTVLVFVLFVNSKRGDFVLSFFLMSLLLIILSVVLLTTGADTFRLLNLINLLYTSLFALGILIFGFRNLKRGFHKNLHI